MPDKSQLMVDLGDRSYPIYIESGLLKRIGELFITHKIPTSSPILIVTDENVAPLYLDSTIHVLQNSGYKVGSIVVPAGEKTKSLEMLDRIVEQALLDGLDRKSTIVALGGGVVGDLAGFAAASFMRGVRFVQVPTTILAHDSSVGGKVAVNHRLAKNIIGAFHQPEMVIYDLDTLLSLPIRDVRSGLSEVIKHGLIWDASFVKWTSEHVDALLALDLVALQHALYEGCRIKSIVVSQDEKEGGLRAILNLGHTIGHALEAVASYNEMLHGEAIAVGMIGSAMLAVNAGADEQILITTKDLFEKFGLPTAIPSHMDLEAILVAMQHDKKFSGGQMNFVLPTAIGEVEFNQPVQLEQVITVIKQLKGEQ